MCSLTNLGGDEKVQVLRHQRRHCEGDEDKQKARHHHLAPKHKTLKAGDEWWVYPQERKNRLICYDNRPQGACGSSEPLVVLTEILKSQCRSIYLLYNVTMQLAFFFVETLYFRCNFIAIQNSIQVQCIHISRGYKINDSFVRSNRILRVYVIYMQTRLFFYVNRHTTDPIEIILIQNNLPI